MASVLKGEHNKKGASLLTEFNVVPHAVGHLPSRFVAALQQFKVSGSQIKT